MTLETLYKPTKTGKTQTYVVSAEDGVVTVVQGQLDGEKQTYLTRCTPKNVGKANETTPVEQAELEAMSKWNKKVKSGYSVSISSEIAVKLPQKVKTYQDLWKTEKTAKALEFPCWTSFKLNGINGVYNLSKEGLTLKSRGGESFEVPPHHIEPITALMKKFKLSYLNVELYIHGWHLQDIQSCVTKHKEGTEKLVACIFEIPELDLTFKEKVLVFKKLKKHVASKGVDYKSAVDVIIPVKVKDKKEIDNYLKLSLSLKYEGIVVTNSRKLYKFNERSSDVWKYKLPKDKEFRVVGYVIDKYNHPVFICITPEGLEFKVKPKGTNEERLKLAKEADSYIGKWLNVEFETYSKDLKPQKPVGIYFRECDSDSNPLI